MFETHTKQFENLNTFFDKFSKFSKNLQCSITTQVFLKLTFQQI